MCTLERQLYTKSHLLDALDVHQEMVVIQPGTIDLSSSIHLMTAGGRKHCNIIATYHLLDVVCALQTGSGPSHCPHYPRMPLKGLVPPEKVSSTIVDSPG